MRPAGWEAKFHEPIPVSKGKPLAILREAAQYITKLPKVDHDASEWHTAMHCVTRQICRRQIAASVLQGHPGRFMKPERDIYDGVPWSEINIRDLIDVIGSGGSVTDAATRIIENLPTDRIGG